MCELLVQYFHFHFLLIFVWVQILTDDLHCLMYWAVKIVWFSSRDRLVVWGTWRQMTQVTVSLHESESDVVNLVKLCIILECYLDTILRADKIWLYKQIKCSIAKFILFLLLLVKYKISADNKLANYSYPLYPQFLLPWIIVGSFDFSPVHETR